MTTTVTVSNSVQLQAALTAAAKATSPETILVAGGTYSLKAQSGLNPTANVTIESASSSNKAVIDGLQISHSSNITFNDLTFTTYSAKPTGEAASSYFDNNVNFTNDSFVGPVSSSYTSAPFQGLVICDSTNSTVSGSVFQYVQNGLTQKENNGITIKGNSFSNLFGDGIDNAASSNVNIINNSFTNIHIDKTDGQHSDCIQFWTSGEKTAGSNITIDGNSYNIGSGAVAQGIFLTDQVGSLTYSNVTIENNDMVGTDWNGITLQHVSNALVENNRLQTVAGTGVTSRLTLDGAVSGLIENNAVGQLVNQNGNSATVTGTTILAAISLGSSAQSLVSSMASIASTAAAGTATPLPQLAAYNAYLANNPISLPKA
ncbi:MAG: right-handed parallel beta-helix repeat-containing protein [Caulobacteraceae bacterium]|nr:right-handed parallel beta-helix repeat-containing protein [Caulobacteraceae bacterium]